MDKTSHAFLPLAFDVFCGTAPRADEFLRRLASIVVTRRTGYSEGPNFSPNYGIVGILPTQISLSEYVCCAMLPVNNVSAVVTITRLPVGHTHSQMDQWFRPQHPVAAFIDQPNRLHQQNRLHGERVVLGERVLPNNLVIIIIINMLMPAYQ